MGTIALLALTGLLVFMVFFVAATVNAIIISLLMSLAAAGGFLALFFGCLTAIYIGALSVAVFVISTTTTIAIFAVIVATGIQKGVRFLLQLKHLPFVFHVFCFRISYVFPYMRVCLQRV